MCFTVADLTGHTEGSLGLELSIVQTMCGRDGSDTSKNNLKCHERLSGVTRV